jgi:TM2 domain-containing membrane protein YozV
VEYRRFEQEFLRLAFTTSVELTPSALAFFTNISIRQTEAYMERLVSQGVLELASDEDGHVHYVMPDRPTQPIAVELGEPGVEPAWSVRGAAPAPPPYPDPPALAPPRAIVVKTLRTPAPPSDVTPGQAVAAMFLNAMVCPGIGSMVGGKTRAGLAQLSLFLVGIPLIVVAVGLPMIVASWTWGIATGAQLIAEARS